MQIPAGKLPSDTLKRLLDKYAQPGAGVVVGPGIGVDAAVLDIGLPDACLIAKTDPITLVSEDIGEYAVTINANDVACMGGTPKWFTVALILPEGKADEALVERIFTSLSGACAGLGISLVGGHTEVTHGIDRPIVIGHMLGTVPRDGIITSAGARPGDTVILTKGIAIEAVSVIAREKADELQGQYPREFIERCKGFVHSPGISVARDARVALSAGKVHCFHDPTEGGLATGLYEIAEAAGVGMEIRESAITVLPEARELMGRYRLDPLGSIASGSLVITAAPGDSEKILAALASEGIPASAIGTVKEKSYGVKLICAGQPVDMPKFERDEITKLF